MVTVPFHYQRAMLNLNILSNYFVSSFSDLKQNAARLLSQSGG